MLFKDGKATSLLDIDRLVINLVTGKLYVYRFIKEDGDVGSEEDWVILQNAQRLSKTRDPKVYDSYYVNTYTPLYAVRLIETIASICGKSVDFLEHPEQKDVIIGHLYDDQEIELQLENPPTT